MVTDICFDGECSAAGLLEDHLRHVSADRDFADRASAEKAESAERRAARHAACN